MALLPFGVLFVLLALFLGTVVHVSSANGSTSILIVALFGGFGVYMLAKLTRARLILDGTRIEVRGAFTTKSADRSEIEGFRTIQTRNGSYTQMLLKQGMGTLSVSSSFDTDEAYRAWLRQVPDLDQRDRRQILDEIEHEAELGATPEERLSALATAKTWAVFLSIITGVAAAAMAFAPDDFRVVSACALAVLPVGAILLLLRSPLLYAVFKPKADPRAELSFILILAGFGLMIRSGSVSFVAWTQLLYFVVPVCAAYLAALLHATRKGMSRPGTWIALLLFAAIYSFGLAVVTDTATDRAPATTYATRVVGKHVSHGRSTSYSLTLNPWGPYDSINRMGVNAHAYYAFEIGDRICVDLHPGSLHVPWYRPADCHGLQLPDQP
ncbi:MAG TPA: hypothetical protein VHZ28_17650 [Terracidiphilus sp.]|jgi:hypothetical protein|nr:hypothetical protein [Terracidiphilus sp.]